MTMPSMTKTLLLAAALLVGIACNDSTSPPTPAGSPTVASVTVALSPGTLLVGSTVQLTATTKDSAGNVLTGRAVTWASSDTAVATVSATGLVTGVAVGSAMITATAEGKNGTAAVTVTAPPPVLVASVTVAPATVLVGMTVQLTAATKDAAGNVLTGRTVTWATSNPAVATVNSTGLATGVAGGQATITATSEGQSGTAAITVVVLTFATVSGGGDHTCGVTTGGTAYCWGDNGLGQLGTGTTTNSATPVAVAGGLTFAAVSASTGSFTCGLTVGGAAYCWGANDVGMLGTGSSGQSSVPVAVAGGLRFGALSTGYDHTCALTANGTPYCWGANQFGQLGTGPAGGPQFCVDNFPCSTVPAAVSGGLTFAAVSAGTGATGFTCGLTPGGAAYCWGYNGDGELGTGTTTNNSTPLAVGGGFTFAAVSTGAYHICGLTKNGAAYCWGYSGFGEFGDGSYGRISQTPVAVSGGLTFAAVSAGLFNTCGITASVVLYCWGANGAGELGIGSTTGPELCNANDLDYLDPCSTVPVAVSGGLTFAVVSVADFYSCGGTTGGAAYCWGTNFYGQLGTGTTTSSSVPVKVAGQP
jgi:alpha-tubulin suppressor-like RCC1 family protein